MRSARVAFLLLLLGAVPFLTEAHQTRLEEAKPRLWTSVWYLDGRQSVRMVLSISDTGAVVHVRDVENFALQNEFRDRLSGKTLAEIKKRIEALPQSEAAPPLRDRLVVFTGKSEKPRFYRLSKLPESVKDVYLLTKGRLP